MKFVSNRPNLVDIDYICYEQDLDINENMMHQTFPQQINSGAFNQCGDIIV